MAGKRKPSRVKRVSVVTHQRVLNQLLKTPSFRKGYEEELDKLRRLEHGPRFLRRIASARQSLRKGRGVKLEDIQW